MCAGCRGLATKMSHCREAPPLRSRIARCSPILFEPVASPYLVSFDGGFRIAAAATAPPDGAPGKKENVAALEDLGRQAGQAAAQALRRRQLRGAPGLPGDGRRRQGRHDPRGPLGREPGRLPGLQLQGAERRGARPRLPVAPHAVRARARPDRGVEPQPLRGGPGGAGQAVVPRRPEAAATARATLDELWAERYESIRGAEQHLARNGVVILKFFLHVSPEEQRKRLLDRIDDPSVNWKFEGADLAMRRAGATSCAPTRTRSTRPAGRGRRGTHPGRLQAVHAPRGLGDRRRDRQRLDLQWPEVSAEARAEMLKQREELAKS